MKGTLIALDTWNGRKAAARIIDGTLDDLIVDPIKTDIPRPGSIYRAVADRPMKGQGGATVKLPCGQRGFLRDTKEQIQIGISGSLKKDMTAQAYIPGKGYPVQVDAEQFIKKDDWNTLRIKVVDNTYST